MEWAFEYSWFFEDKKAVTLWELQQHFGFLQLKDPRNIVDEILAFEWISQVVSKSTDTIVLTSKRVETILQWIKKWQSEQEKIIMKRLGKKWESPQKKNSINTWKGMRMKDVLSKCIQLTPAHWSHATRIYKDTWFFITPWSNRTDRIYCLREEFLDTFIRTYSDLSIHVWLEVNDTTRPQKITDSWKFLKNAKSI